MANKNRRKRTRGSANATDKPSHDSQKPVPILVHLRRACLAATAALLVATVLATTDTSPESDTFAVLGMMWPVLLAIWAVVAFSSAGGEIRWNLTDIALAVLLLLIVTSGVVAIGAGQGSPRPTINMIWRWIGCGIAYFLIRQLVRTRVQARALVAVMISLAVGLAALGCYQYFVTYPQKENRWEQLSEETKQQEIVNAGITYSKPGTPERKQLEDRWRSDEPLATFSLTNSLAGYLAPWLIVALWIFVEAWKDKRSHWATLLMRAACCLLIAACLLLTKSRTAILATACGVGLIAFQVARVRWRLSWRVPTAALLLVVVVVLSAFMIMGGMDSQVLSGAPKSVLYRIEYWQATAAMIRDQPLFGCGPGNYQSTYTSYKLPQASEVVADPHNLLFEVWSNAGTLSLLALATAAWLFFRHVRQNVSDVHATADSNDSEEQSNGNGLLADNDQLSIQFVLAGGLIGIPVALFSGVLISQNRDPEFFYSLIPAMLAAAAIFYPWVRRGKLACGQLLAGLIVLLINLLAAGSLGFPSVAVTGWMFVALTLNMSNESQRVLRVSRQGSVVVLICACTIVVACHQTLYRPVLTRLGAMGELSRASGFRESEEAMLISAAESAAEADPFSTQPWLSLSGLYFNSWQQLHHNKADQEQVAKAWTRFEFAADRTRVLSPRSSQRRMQIGNLHLKAYQVSHQREKLDAALEWYQEGLSLYPNNALLHVQLAWAWDLAGNETQAIDAAKRASELDDINPHPELKLTNRVIYTGLANKAPEKKAEQVVNEIRKREKGN